MFSFFKKITSKSPVGSRQGPEPTSLEPVLIPASQHGLSEASISSGARKVIKALREAGYAAELVGGCVRDLLLGQTPKDFDVVTDALPEEVRQVFRRARLIGRRFRLAHVRMGREVIEVSTYRASSANSGQGGEVIHGDYGRILRDNVFGTRDEDVLRRDFTANALYYDPVKNHVIDYVNGFEDIHQRRLRFIGEPAERLSEDPVRMLRAVRFKAKLGLTLGDQIEDLIRDNAFLLRHVPPARLFDEVLKMFHHGCAVSVFSALRELHLFAELFPQADRAFESIDVAPGVGLVWRALENTDRRVQVGKPVIAAFLFAALLWRAVRIQRDRYVQEGMPILPAIQRSATMVVGRENQRVAIPRRVSTVIFEIWELQDRLEARRPRTIARLLENKRFRAAYDFLVLRSQAGELDEALTQWWTKIQEVDPPEQQQMIKLLKGGGSGHKRRRARKRPSKSTTKHRE